MISAFDQSTWIQMLGKSLFHKACIVIGMSVGAVGRCSGGRLATMLANHYFGMSSRRSGGQMAKTLVATINDIIF